MAWLIIQWINKKSIKKLVFLIFNSHFFWFMEVKLAKVSTQSTFKQCLFHKDRYFFYLHWILSNIAQYFYSCGKETVRIQSANINGIVWKRSIRCTLRRRNACAYNTVHVVQMLHVCDTYLLSKRCSTLTSTLKTLQRVLYAHKHLTSQPTDWTTEQAFNWTLCLR